MKSPVFVVKNFKRKIKNGEKLPQRIDSGKR